MTLMQIRSYFGLVVLGASLMGCSGADIHADIAVCRGRRHAEHHRRSTERLDGADLDPTRWTGRAGHPGRRQRRHYVRHREVVHARRLQYLRGRSAFPDRPSPRALPSRDQAACLTMAFENVKISILEPREHDCAVGDAHALVRARDAAVRTRTRKGASTNRFWLLGVAGAPIPATVTQSSPPSRACPRTPKVVESRSAK